MENKKYLSTYSFGDFSFPVAFIAIPIEKYSSYMKSFHDELNAYLDSIRPGRCIIGYKKSGKPICCPKDRLCSNCVRKYEYERYNPKTIISITLPESYELIDMNAVNPEEYVINNEQKSVEEMYEFIIRYFEENNPRYATIIKLMKRGVAPEKIAQELFLSKPRGYAEINNAYKAVCNLLQYNVCKKKYYRK